MYQVSKYHEKEIGFFASFVDLVDDDVTDVRQVRIRFESPEQNSGRAKEKSGRARSFALESDLVSDHIPDSLDAFLRNSLRHSDGRNSARLSAN
jgi:hypothetical protein